MSIQETQEQFLPLLQCVDGEEGCSDRALLKQFARERSVIGRLGVLKDMSLTDMLSCIGQFGSPKGNHYFNNRLKSYQDTLLPKGVSSRAVRTGIVRDALYALMADTPERAIYDEAREILRENGCGEECLPQLLGRHSHITDRGIGYAYHILHDLYVMAAQHGESEGDAFVSDPVEVAAEWLATAMQYASPETPIRGERPLREAIAWAQVPDSVLRERLRDLRRGGRSLRNLNRFFGVVNGKELLHAAVVLSDSVASVYSPIDWINHASFPSIHRSYQSLKNGGVPSDIVFKEIIAVVLGSSKSEKSDEERQAVRALYRKAVHDLSSAKQEIENMVKVGTVLAHHNCPYAFHDVIAIARERFDGLSQAIALHGLQPVKEHLSRGGNLRAISKEQKDTGHFSIVLDSVITDR